MGRTISSMVRDRRGTLKMSESSVLPLFTKKYLELIRDGDIVLTNDECREIYDSMIEFTNKEKISE